MTSVPNRARTRTPRSDRARSDRAPCDRAGTDRAPGRLALALLLLLTSPLVGAAFGQSLASVPATSYEPFYPVAGEGPHDVPAFEIAVVPVTNADYLAFVQDHPAWAKGAPPAIFADPGYLVHWAGPTDLGDAPPDAAVTNVSWFAAGAYCDAHGLRLPSEDEWEVAARADAHRADASDDPVVRAKRLAAYARRSAPPTRVGQGTPNLHGVHDLHEAVWEWVEDPWSGIVQGDSRNIGDRDVARVCGGASLGARDRGDYPAFLRHAVRTALGPSAVTGSVGFRCAR